MQSSVGDALRGWDLGGDDRRDWDWDGDWRGWGPRAHAPLFRFLMAFSYICPSSLNRSVAYM
jgi:hypothetical protein